MFPVKKKLDNTNLDSIINHSIKNIKNGKY